MRIFHGISAVSLQSTRYLADALRADGHTCDSVVYRNDGPLFDMEDRNLHINFRKYYLYPIYVFRILRLFFYALRSYDVFHFHYGHSFLPMNVDMWLLKKLHKAVFMEYHGTDIRFIYYKVGKDCMECYTDKEKREHSFRLQRRVARHADGIIVHDRELVENLCDTKTPVYIVPLRLDMKRFAKTDFSDNRPVTVVHAPSHRGKKGTEYVLEAVAKLKETYDINFILVENMSYLEAQKVYAKADIVIDQLLIGSYGMLAVECMAQGKVVICYITEDTTEIDDVTSALCSTDAFSLYDRLAELIAKPEIRREYHHAARAFVEAHHDSLVCARQLLKIYEGALHNG